MTKRKSFIFNAEWAEALADYPAEARLEVYEATISYALYGKIVELSSLAKGAFLFIKNDIDRNNENVEAVSKSRSRAGRMGMAKRWNNNAPKCTDDENPVTKITNVMDVIEPVTKITNVMDVIEPVTKITNVMDVIEPVTKITNVMDVIEPVTNDNRCHVSNGESVSSSQCLGVAEKERPVAEQISGNSDEEKQDSSRVRSSYILNIIPGDINITPTREIKKNQEINLLNKKKERESPPFGGETEILQPLNCEKKSEKQPSCCETLVAERETRTDYAKIVELYHSTCKSFPRIRGLTEQRKAKVKQRLAEMGGNLDTLAEVFRKMEASEFMKSGAWASFDWIFANSQNWMKVLEGNYDNDRRNNQNGKFNSRFDAEFNLRTGACGVDKADYPDSF